MALASLSRELGDPHRASTRELDRALFGAPPSARALLADGPEGLSGVLLYAPIFSTVRGGAGIFVSDIWIDPAARGRKLGIRLLHAAAENAAALWDAGFMRLSVHDHNTMARKFYEKLGFHPVGAETVMVLAGQDFQHLRRMT